MMSWQRTGNFT